MAKLAPRERVVLDYGQELPGMLRCYTEQGQNIDKLGAAWLELPSVLADTG